MKKFAVIILGVNIGTAESWDQVDSEEVCFMDFVPENGFVWEYDHINFNWQDGLFKEYDDDGKIVRQIKALDVLKNTD